MTELQKMASDFFLGLNLWPSASIGFQEPVYITTKAEKVAANAAILGALVTTGATFGALTGIITRIGTDSLMGAGACAVIGAYLASDSENGIAAMIGMAGGSIVNLLLTTAEYSPTEIGAMTLKVIAISGVLSLVSPVVTKKLRISNVPISAGAGAIAGAINGNLIGGSLLVLGCLAGTALQTVIIDKRGLKPTLDAESVLKEVRRYELAVKTRAESYGNVGSITSVALLSFMKGFGRVGAFHASVIAGFLYRRFSLVNDEQDKLPEEIDLFQKSR